MNPQAQPGDYIEQLRARVNLRLFHLPLPPDLLQKFPQLNNHFLEMADLQYPELQQALASIVRYTPDKWLLEQEKPFIIERRRLHHPAFTAKSSANIHSWARSNQLSGLCFSGGGIRSATFNLGVLQAMAMRGWLDDFDYLSSVSGGGYIHSWLAAWLLRKSKEVGSPQAGWQHVMKRLHPLPCGEQSVWPRQIQWLRRYSNYLTPQVGLMSGDTWSAFAIWLRNVLLNQALLLTVFLLILCLPHALAPKTKLQPLGSHTVNAAIDYGVQLGHYLQAEGRPLPPWREWLPKLRWTWTALFCYVVGCVVIGRLLRLEYDQARPGYGEQIDVAWRSKTWTARLRRNEFKVVCAGVVLPLFGFGYAMNVIVLRQPPSYVWTIKVFLMLLLLVWIETLAGGAVSNSAAQRQDLLQACDPGVEHKPGRGYAFGIALFLLLLGIPAALSGTVMTAAIAALMGSGWLVDFAHWLLLSDPWPVQLAVGTLLFFWVAPLTMTVTSGMIGKRFPGWMGEWLARIRGYTMITGVGWMGLCGGALLLPGMAVRAAHVHWFAWSSVSAWLLTTLTGVLSGKSGKTSGDQHHINGALDVVAVVAPYIYISGLLVLLSWLVFIAQNHDWPARFYGWCGLMGLLFAMAALLQWRLDVNQFSMHSFYRNRLTRCYLGASNAVRNPSPVAGFDEHDSSDLCIKNFTPDRYPGPIPIFSCAINITMGEDLAWQERKAASFAITPYYSGYTVNWTGKDDAVKFNGFVPTSMLYPGGPTVATAMAASGAAVSPNWGYHTNPATAFLLTMFDARLGLWVPNPRRSEVAGRQMTKAKVPSPSPPFAIGPLGKELLGSVGDAARYVYVTDGGHFDNSGLYELVRRRCYRIVICDAEEDGSFVFEGIGGAIRKCRIDFGVEIELDLSGLVPNSKTVLSPVHVARGFIRYPEAPGDGERGTVTYIKSSLAGKAPPAVEVEGRVGLPDVSGDVQAYKRQHTDFPHDSTAEQWFTESQFESYRRLGQRIVQGMPTLY